MSKDLFKEAIADAKAVREAALANAKLALEEAFTPHIKEMLAAKIEEMDKDLDEAKDEETMEEVALPEAETENLEEDYTEDGSVSEELSLEEILAELEAAELEEAKDEKELDEAKKENKEDLDEVIDLEALLAEADEEESDEETEEESEETEEEVGEMTVEELKDLIRSIVGEMGGASTEEMPADEESSEDMTVDLDEIIAESEELEEVKEDVDEVMMGEIPDWQFALALLAPALGIGTAALATFKDEIKAAFQKKDAKKAAEIGKEIHNKVEGGKTVSESEEALAEIEALRTELNETNLLNAKLLYSSKILRANELNENQKLRVINAFDKAANVSEAKLIYETIKDSFSTAKEKKQIKESLGFASKPTGVAPKNQIVEQPDSTVARLQKLAGII